MAQQSPLLSRFGEAGLLLVGVRHHLLHAEADVLLRVDLGSQGRAGGGARRERQALLAPMPRPPDRHTLGELKAAVEGGHWLDAPDAVEPYLVDFRRLYHGATPLVLLPGSVAEVARILEICNRQ